VWFDTLPAWLRHVLLMLIPSLATGLLAALAYAQSHVDDIVTWLNIPAPLAAVAASILVSVIGSLILRFTGLTNQYGVGSAPTTVSSEGYDLTPPPGVTLDQHTDTTTVPEPVPAPPVEVAPTDVGAVDPSAAADTPIADSVAVAAPEVVAP
jgi:hypothetical protein